MSPLVKEARFNKRKDRQIDNTEELVDPNAIRAPGVTYRKPPSEEITRSEAQRRAVTIFGPRAFARKKSGTAAGARCEIGIRKVAPPFQVVVIGAGKTWREATEAAVRYVEEAGK